MNFEFQSKLNFVTLNSPDKSTHDPQKLSVIELFRGLQRQHLKDSVWINEWLRF